MRPGEGLKKDGDPLHHTYKNLNDDRTYTLRYCPDCCVLFKVNTDNEEFYANHG